MSIGSEFDENELASGPLLAGVDSLYVAYPFDVATSDIDFEKLAYLKELAARDRSRAFGEVDIGTETFAVLPFGRSIHCGMHCSCMYQE